VTLRGVAVPSTGSPASTRARARPRRARHRPADARGPVHRQRADRGGRLVPHCGRATRSHWSRCSSPAPAAARQAGRLVEVTVDGPGPRSRAHDRGHRRRRAAVDGGLTVVRAGGETRGGPLPRLPGPSGAPTRPVSTAVVRVPSSPSSSQTITPPRPSASRTRSSGR
jgi:hypothetical protein